MKNTNKEENRVAYQSHFFTNNNLFKIGRAGKKRLIECEWFGAYTDGESKVEYTIEAEGTRTMNGFDQDVFLLILYLHRLQHKRTKKDGNHEKINPTGIAKLDQYVELDFCSHELIKMLSWQLNTNSYKRLHRSLERLSRVYLLCHAESTSEKMRWSSHLLSYRDYRDYPKKNHRRFNLKLSICPLLTLVAQNAKKTTHSSHIIQERLRLSPAAKIIHGAICSKLRPGKKQRFKTATLISYMVEDISKISRQQKHKAISAIIELRDLDGWKSKHSKDSDTWNFYRPPIVS